MPDLDALERESGRLPSLPRFRLGSPRLLARAVRSPHLVHPHVAMSAWAASRAGSGDLTRDVRTSPERTGHYSRPVSNRPHHLPTLGEVIRRQRELAELPMRPARRHGRHLQSVPVPDRTGPTRAVRAGAQAIAAALRTSADALVDLATRDAAAAPARPPVIAAIEKDTGLTARQRQALAEVYTAMIEATAGRCRRGRGDSTPEPSGGG
jgi:hypothetical protein